MQNHGTKPKKLLNKPKKRKRYRLKAGAKKRNLILAGISVMLILIAWLVLGRGYEYTGLEDPEDYPLSGLDMNCVFRNEDGFRVYDDGKVKGIPGIDVSEYQKSIDWEKVKKAGAQFAIIRLGYSSASDGSLHLDSRYEENIKGALDAGDQGWRILFLPGHNHGGSRKGSGIRGKEPERLRYNGACGL